MPVVLLELHSLLLLLLLSAVCVYLCLSAPQWGERRGRRTIHTPRLRNPLFSRPGTSTSERLAFVQVVFGHGHPVTSGSPAVDYFIGSDLFETAETADAREAALRGSADSDDDGADTIGNNNNDPDREVPSNSSPSTRKTGTGKHPDYSEQLVLFDTLSATIDVSLGPDKSPAVLAAEARELTGLEDEDHAYHCVQHSKKMHPEFDAVLKGILLGDPAAKVLLAAGSKVHMVRWERILGASLMERLVFLPRVPQSEMLVIMSYCRVMLDTFPWGAGVTSLEALSRGLPVVTLPSSLSVLHLAAGQIRELRLEEELIASSVEDMVKKSIRLASDPNYRRYISSRIFGANYRLFDSSVITREWESFLERALVSATP